MIDKVKETVNELLKSGQIEGFLGLRRSNGHIGPHLFRDTAELDDLVVGDGARAGDSRYPLNKMLIHLARCHPEATFGILVRGCDERGLKALYEWNQLDPSKVVAVGISCPGELAEACECRKPYPDERVDGDIIEGKEQPSVDEVDRMTVAERLNYWMQEFDRCIKCYGCRDVCPMCFCKECSLETDELIRTGEIPPENPVFHLTRAVHMAGRCIDCGLCNEACPADIPLRTLYKKVAEIIDEKFHYRPGYTTDRKSPLNVLGTTSEE